MEGGEKRKDKEAGGGTYKLIASELRAGISEDIKKYAFLLPPKFDGIHQMIHGFQGSKVLGATRANKTRFPGPEGGCFGP